jgi:hypothetical protein
MLAISFDALAGEKVMESVLYRVSGVVELP